MISCGFDPNSPAKAFFRKEAARRLAALTETEIAEGNADIVRQVLSHPAYLRANCIFTYVSTGREVGTHAIIADALACGKTVCVPRCLAGGRMEICHIRSMSDLTSSRFKIPEPPEGTPIVPIGQVDLALVPCVAANRSGLRLGHGGGYYDRFLADFPGTSLLLCREALIFPHIPKESHDRLCTELICDAK